MLENGGECERERENVCRICMRVTERIRRECVRERGECVCEREKEGRMGV